MTDLPEDRRSCAMLENLADRPRHCDGIAVLRVGGRPLACSNEVNHSLPVRLGHAVHVDISKRAVGFPVLLHIAPFGARHTVMVTQTEGVACTSVRECPRAVEGSRAKATAPHMRETGSNDG